jgi:hypothetical protein
MRRLAHPRKLFLFTTLSVFDLGLTWLLLEWGNGSAYESNPVASWWLASFGWPGLAGFKLGIVLLVAGLIQVVSQRRPAAAGRVMEFACFALLAVVLYSGLLVPGVAAEVGQAGQRVNHAHEWKRQRDLEIRSKAMLRVIAIKNRAAQEVIAGRLALPEAAAVFRDLNHGRTDFDMQRYRRTWPGLTDEERYAREVIAMARSLLIGRPGQARVVTNRMEEELDDLLRYGKPQLPW